MGWDIAGWRENWPRMSGVEGLAGIGADVQGSSSTEDVDSRLGIRDRGVAYDSRQGGGREGSLKIRTAFSGGWLSVETGRDRGRTGKNR